MNEELKTGLIELLNKIIEGIEKGTAFVADQTPLVVQEFLNWAIVSYSFFTFLGLICLILGIYSINFIFREMPKKENGELYDSYGRWMHERNISKRGSWFISQAIVGLSVGTPMFFIGLYKLLYVLVAPRVYLIEHISKML